MQEAFNSFDYLHYSKDNGSLKVDFTYLKDPGKVLWINGGTIETNYVDSVTFEFIITKYF